ncbi:MAG: tRNA (adenosine(37)-N6)-threonylcarbamoyltransferase complex ATPase subunit type 1 TsaE [bacterium]
MDTRIEQSQIIVTKSPDATEQIGHELAGELTPGSVLALFGDLGSGKTTLIKGICKGLGVKTDITSPTFTLIQEYEGRLPVYHFDFYRIENREQVWELGCEDYFYSDGVCLIEWADRIQDWLPERRIEIHLRSRFEQGLLSEREIRIVNP